MLVNMSCFAGGVVVTLVLIYYFRAAVFADLEDAKRENARHTAIYRHIYDDQKRAKL